MSDQARLSDTPTRPFAYISGVLDVSNGRLYTSSEGAMAEGSLPVNLVVLSAAAQSIRKIIVALAAVRHAS